MPKTEAQLERIKDHSRGRILGAALALFARQGYERTSIRAIAAEAKISQGLMYNYFAGKDELLRAIFSRSMAAARASFAPAAPDGLPADRIERVIRASLELVGRDVEFWRLSYSLRMQPSVLGRGAEEIRAWSDTLRREIESVLGAAGVPNAPVETAVLFALIDGVAQHHAMAPRRYPIEEVTSAVVARYRALCS
jgi:AcrR family transcriptional regulator